MQEAREAVNSPVLTVCCPRYMKYLHLNYMNNISPMGPTCSLKQCKEYTVLLPSQPFI